MYVYMWKFMRILLTWLCETFLPPIYHLQARDQESLWYHLVGVWRPENQSSWCCKSQSEEQRRLDAMQCPGSVSEGGNGANSSFLCFLFNGLEDAHPHWGRNSSLLTLVLSGNILTAPPRNNVNLSTHGSLKWRKINHHKSTSCQRGTHPHLKPHSVTN